MDLNALLTDLFGRVDEHVHEALEGLAPELLTVELEPGTNPIGWLVWHLTRVQDDHMADIMGEEQIWAADDWGPKFGVASDPSNHGYGHTAAEVAAIQPESVEALIEYHEAVSARTRGFIASVTEADLDRIVDRNWDPPVTMGVRIISIADDDIQHAGQAVYARGILDRR